MSNQIVSALLDRLSGVIDRQQLLTSDEALAPYECDGLSAYRRRPLMVILPDTIEQAQTVLKTCHEMEIPVVARGAGTYTAAH